jgi:Tat protein translocase TatB subunit
VGNIGGPELLVVLIIALLVLGPTRLPEAARSMGKAMAEFRRVTGGLQAEVRDAMSQLENEVNGVEPQAPRPPLPPQPPAGQIQPPAGQIQPPPAGQIGEIPPPPPQPPSDSV